MSATRQDITELGTAIVGIIEVLASGSDGRCYVGDVAKNAPQRWEQIKRLIDLFIEKGGELGGEPWPDSKS